MTTTAIGARVEVPLAEIADAPPRQQRYDIVALPYRIVVFVPSKSAEGQLLDSALRRTVGTDVKSVLSEFAGGCTTMRAVASWIDPLGGLMDEEIVTVESYSAVPFSEDVIDIVVRLIAGQLSQHTVALIVHDTMVHITPSE